MQINTVTQQASQQNSEKPKPTCYHCKKPDHYRNQYRQLKRGKDRIRNNTNSAENTNNINGSAPTNSNPNNKVPDNTSANKTNNQRDRRCRPVFRPYETCGKTNQSKKKSYLGANTANRPPPRNRHRRLEGQNQVQQRNAQKQLRWECPSCSQNIKLETPRLHSGAACDRLETNEIPKLPPIPEVVWQQPTETITNEVNLNNTKNDSSSKTTVASQTSPPKGTQPQNYVVTTEQPPGNQTGNEPVPLLNCSKNCSADIQNPEQHVMTTLSGDTTNPPLTTATPLIEEGLVRDEQTNEIYLPLTS